ncbi:hypothetical protein Tco_0149153 [Tanacetum coccineum]
MCSPCVAHGAPWPEPRGSVPLQSNSPPNTTPLKGTHHYLPIENTINGCVLPGRSKAHHYGGTPQPQPAAFSPSLESTPQHRKGEDVRGPITHRAMGRRWRIDEPSDDDQVMAISVILVSSNSSEDSMGTPARRVILFGTIPTTIPDTTPVITPPVTLTDTTKIPIIAPNIPLSPDYTPASPDYSPASETESDSSEDPSSDHVLPLPAISQFLSSADDTTCSDRPDTPQSSTFN